MVKKLFLGLTISAIICGGAMVANAEEKIDESKTYMLGDVDMNGQIDSTDYLRIKSDFLGVLELKGTEYAMADVNFDGVIDSTDYISIKKTLLKEMILDDSAWEGQDSKPEFVKNGEFAVQFNDNHGESIFNYTIDNSINVIKDGVLHYTNWDFIYDEVYESLPQEIIVENLKGNEVKVKHDYTYVNAFGEMTHWYEDKNLNTYYIDNEGNIVGYNPFDGALDSAKSEEMISDEQAASIGLEIVKKIWKGKTFKFENIVLKTSLGYRMTYREYINGIKTTNYAEIWLGNYGELRGFYYHDSGINKYDFRSFNVNDDVSVYREKIVQLGTELISDDNFVKNYLQSSKESIANMKITISEPSFGIGADGKLAGFTWITFEDEDSGFSKSEFVGFYAEERLSTANKVS